MTKINFDSVHRLSTSSTSTVAALKQELQKLRNEKEALLKTLNERDETLANMFSYLQSLASK